MKQKSTTSLKSSSQSLNQSSSLNKTTGSKKRKRVHQSYKDIYLEKKNFDPNQYYKMASGSINNSASSQSQRGSINSSTNKFNNSLSFRKSATITKEENLKRNFERKTTVPLPHSKDSSTTKKLKSSLNHDSFKKNSGFSLEDGTNRNDNEKKKTKFLEVMVPGEELVKSKGELRIEDLSEIKNDELEVLDNEGKNINFDEKETKESKESKEKKENAENKENTENKESKSLTSGPVNEKDLNQIVSQVKINSEQIEKNGKNLYTLKMISNNNDNEKIGTDKDKDKQEILSENNLKPKESVEDNNENDVKSNPNKQGKNLLIKKKKLSSIKGEEEEDVEENSSMEKSTQNLQLKQNNQLSLANKIQYNSSDHVNNIDKSNSSYKNNEINAKINNRYCQSNESPCSNIETDFTQRKPTNYLNIDTNNIHSSHYSPMTTSPSNFQIVHETEHSSKSIQKSPTVLSIIKSDLYIKKDKNDNLNAGTQTVNDINHSTSTQTDTKNKFENNLITYTQTEIRGKQVSNLSTHTQTELKEIGHYPSASNQEEIKEENNKCINEQREINHNRFSTEPILYNSNKFEFSKEALKDKKYNFEHENLVSQIKKKQQKKENNYLENLKKEKEEELQVLREKKEMLSDLKTLRKQNKNQSPEKNQYKIYNPDQSQSLEKRLPELLNECVLTNLIKAGGVSKIEKPRNLYKQYSSPKQENSLSESKWKMIDAKSILSLRNQKIKEEKFYDLNHYNNQKSNLSEGLNTKLVNKMDFDKKSLSTKYLNKLKEDQIKRETQSYIRSVVRSKNKSCLPEEKPITSHFITTNGIMPSNTMKELYEAQYHYLYHLK